MTIPIFSVDGRFFVHELDDVKSLREQHNILGVFIGTLPQYPQQNVFLGLPLLLSAEETRLLVENGVAHVVDDVQQHAVEMKNLSLVDRRAFAEQLERDGLVLAEEEAKSSRERAQRAIDRLTPEQRAHAAAKLEQRQRARAERAQGQTELFDAARDPFTTPVHSVHPKRITPTTSYPPLPMPPAPTTSISTRPIHSEAAYRLFKHLHTLGYFLSPGLRFGCHYCAYPGDPLRFHSHYLARGADWDESIDLLALVGGGRLGTGVKKSYVFGGPVKDPQQAKHEPVRCFSIEWAGM